MFAEQEEWFLRQSLLTKGLKTSARKFTKDQWNDPHYEFGSQNQYIRCCLAYQNCNKRSRPEALPAVNERPRRRVSSGGNLTQRSRTLWNHYASALSCFSKSLS